jgi:trehalose/maltose transport system permease protein
MQPIPTVSAGQSAPSLGPVRPPSLDYRTLRTVGLLLLPTLVTLVVVSLYPVFRGITLSLRNTTLSSQTDSFIGLQNFRTLIGDAQFWNAWRNTIEFTAVSTFVETVLGLAMALVLFETFRGRGVVRASMLVPWAIPTVVTSKMFGWLFDGQNGIINYLLRGTHLIQNNVNWYGSTQHALQTIVIADVWKTTPFMALLLLAGLQSISGTLNEAARVDGASSLQYFWHVRLPLLMPTLLIAALLRALDAFRIFDLPYVLTGGGPADSTETLSTLTYKHLFSGLQFGFGSALAIAMFLTELVIAIGFGVFLLRRMRATGG